MTIYGYERVSRNDQQIERQTAALKNAGCEVIYSEKITGTKKNRPQLDELRKIIGPGDDLILESFSRLSRSTIDLFSLLQEFEENNVRVHSLKENFDTSTAHGKFALTMFIAVSQLERDLISERTKESLAVARARGRMGGRPKKDPKIMKRALDLYDSKQLSIAEIEKTTGVNRSTLYTEINARKKREENK